LAAIFSSLTVTKFFSKQEMILVQTEELLDFIGHYTDFLILKCMTKYSNLPKKNKCNCGPGPESG
jgi:hypothetical protein